MWIVYADGSVAVSTAPDTLLAAERTSDASPSSAAASDVTPPPAGDAAVRSGGAATPSAAGVAATAGGGEVVHAAGNEEEGLAVMTGRGGAEAPYVITLFRTFVSRALASPFLQCRLRKRQALW